MPPRASSSSSSFRWGVCIDDPWTYAGLPPPKSIIIPHLLSVRLPQGPLSAMNFGGEEEEGPGAGRSAAAPSIVSRYLGAPDPEASKLFLATLSRNLALQLRRHGLRFVRCWFPWNMFQPRILPEKQRRRRNPSQQLEQEEDDQPYRFPLDVLVHILNEHGVEVIAVLGNGYHRFLPSGVDADRLGEYVARLGEASREVVRHYRGRVGMWQLENEPNWWREHFASDWRRGGIWLDPGAADAILSELRRVTSEEDPGTPTMVNLEADSARAFSKPYSKYCDVLGLDFYPNYARALPIDAAKLKEKAAEARQLSGKPVMVAETGYPSGPRIFGYSEEKQSEYVRAVCEEAYSADEISALGMWRLSDGYWLSFPFQENHFGLLDFRAVPKPAWFEYANEARAKT